LPHFFALDVADKNISLRIVDWRRAWLYSVNVFMAILPDCLKWQLNPRQDGSDLDRRSNRRLAIATQEILMKHYTLPLVAAAMVAATPVHAQYGYGYGSMMNPMPYANPLTVAIPLAMLATPLLLNSTGMMSPTGMVNPATMMMPLLGAGMMPTYQQYTNPYLNPMATNNPYLNPRAGSVNPYLMRTPTSSSMPGFFPMLPFQQQPAPTPSYGSPAYRPPTGQTSSQGFFPFMPYPQQPAPVQSYRAPAAPAPNSFFPFMQYPQQPAPAQNYRAPATPAANGFFPFFPNAPATTGRTTAPEARPQAPAASMFDPAAWMKMFPYSEPPSKSSGPAIPVGQAAPGN
jgi:hypothetical protein